MVAKKQQKRKSARPRLSSAVPAGPSLPDDTQRPRHGGPYVWVTWLTSLLSGDDHCEWAIWFKAHYQNYTKAPRDFDLVQWTAEHDTMVKKESTRLMLHPTVTAVRVEAQNKFIVKGELATVSGQPDIVSLPADDRPIGVVDCKTGKPRDKDYWQMMLYLLCLPLAYPEYRDKQFLGKVLYRQPPYGEWTVSSDQLTDSNRQRIRDTIAVAGVKTPPPRVPSPRECAWCDIHHCPDRVAGPVQRGVTTTF